jgi:hypothetical protein
MSTSYPYTKFQMISSSGSLIVAMKQNTRLDI